MKKAGRITELLDTQWEFHKGKIKRVHKKELDDYSWINVKIPHDWDRGGSWNRNAKSGTAGGYAQAGYGYYKKTIEVPSELGGKKVALRFDGIYMRATLWFNKEEIGSQLYGYGSFEIDVTDHVKFGEPNELLIEVDNHKQPNCRWYSGSGIYRNAWMIITDKISIPYGGLFVYAFNISEDLAYVRICCEIENSSEVSSSVESLFTINKEDVEIYCNAIKSEVQPKTTKIVEDVAKIEKPLLWHPSPDSPELYTLNVTIKGASGTLDELRQSFGIRNIKFDGSGFYVNGKSILMKGVCLHHDGGCVGAAVPKAVWKRRLKVLKSMGCNAIRTAHNPPATNFLDLCDELGFLVIDEAFDKWPYGSRRHDWIRYGWKDNWKKELIKFIRRDRNHPSVVLWSCGNEVSRATSKKVKRMMSRMRDIVRRLDPSRAVTTVISPNPAKTEASRTRSPLYGDVVDVICTNYTESYLPEFHEVFPHKTCLSTEAYHYWRRRHPQENDLNRFPSKPGHDDYTERNPWWDVKEKDYIAGQFLWTGMEYLGEVRDPWPYHGRTNAPIRISGFKKPQSAFHETVWRQDPVVKIVVLDERADIPRGKIHFDYPKVVWHWNFQNHPDPVFNVFTHTNCDEVELILNGKSLGVKKAADYPLNKMNWQVKYEPGELKAVARKMHGKDTPGRVVEDKLTTAGEAVAIKLITDRRTIKADGHDCAHIETQIVDEQGVRVPDADNMLIVSVTGNGRLLGLDSGDLSSHEPYTSHRCKAFHGRALAIIQSSKDAGEIQISVKSKNMTEQYLKVKTSK